MPTQLTADYLLGRCLVIGNHRWLIVELDRDDRIHCRAVSDKVHGVFPREEVMRLFEAGIIDIEP